MTMRGPRVLVVDDDPETLAVLCTALCRAGFQAVGATTVADALDELARTDYPVVVSDHGMPDIRGVEFLAALRTATPRARLILCSGLVTEEVRRQALAAGVDAILEKPVPLRRLVEAVQGAAGDP